MRLDHPVDILVYRALSYALVCFLALPETGQPQKQKQHDVPAIGTSALTAALDGISRKMPPGVFGAMVVSLDRRDTLFSQGASVAMTPASTMKLFTSALALKRLGPEYAFRTAIMTTASLTREGVLKGNIYLKGGADPGLSARFWRGDPDAPWTAMAAELYSMGIRRVQGSVVADASMFADALVPSGWLDRYKGLDYAAPVSALSVNENVFSVIVSPGPQVRTLPASTTAPVLSRLVAVPGRVSRITASRLSSGEVVLSGTVGASSPPRRMGFVVADPPLFAAGALAAAMLRAGIVVDRPPSAGVTPPSAASLVSLASLPLSQLLAVMGPFSLNHLAELVLRASVSSPGHPGSARLAQAAVRSMAVGFGVDTSLVVVADGSGLSTLDRVTPRAMTRLLGWAEGEPWREYFHAVFPVAGQTATLRRRFLATPAAGNLRAKTGTTDYVTALSGYVSTASGERLAFTFIYNGSHRLQARPLIDRMAVALASSRR